MPDGPNDHLSFDPLDDTKEWPVDQFPLLPVGRMVLDRAPSNFFAEVEQSAFGTGVLVDGIDFSDDKMLQGRTLSYSDTQRYRVGPNYLQLPINAPKAKAYTNQRDGQMAFHVDSAPEQNLHVNYEPSLMGGLKEAAPAGKPYEPLYEGRQMRAKIDRENNFKQAGELWRNEFDETYRAELINNLSGALANAIPAVQEKIVGYCTQADAEYGRSSASPAAWKPVTRKRWKRPWLARSAARNTRQQYEREQEASRQTGLLFIALSIALFIPGCIRSPAPC